MTIDDLPLYLQVPLLLLCGAFCVFMIAGFWRGLSLRPHEDGHKPARSLVWWWWWTGQR